MRAASFSGNLRNTLLPAHVYRLTYSLGVSNAEAGSDDSLAIAQVALTAAIPEPETSALMLSGLTVVGATARRRKAK